MARKSHKQKTTAVVPTPQPETIEPTDVVSTPEPTDVVSTPEPTADVPAPTEPATQSETTTDVPAPTEPATLPESTAPIVAPIARGVNRNAAVTPPPSVMASMNPFHRGAISAAFDLAVRGAKFSEILAACPSVKPAFLAQNIGKGLRDWASPDGRIVGHTGLVWDVLIDGKRATIGTRNTRHPLSLRDMRDGHVRVVNVRRADGELGPE